MRFEDGKYYGWGFKDREDTCLMEDAIELTPAASDEEVPPMQRKVNWRV